MSNYMSQVIGAPGAIVHQIGLDNPVTVVKDRLGVRQAVGVGAGYYLVKKHRYLGGLLGLSLAHNAPALMDGPSARRIALCNIGTMIVGAAVSIMAGGSKQRRAVGFVAGYGAAAAAVHFGNLRG